MSIYKQIFATASIFAIAASALISPAVSAANPGQTGIEITGYSNSNPNYSLCLYASGLSQTRSNAVVVATSASNTVNANVNLAPNANGSIYTLFLQNANNNCTNGSQAGGDVTFTVYPNHTTTVPVTVSGTPLVLTASTTAGQVVNTQPTRISASQINLCVSKTDAVKFEITDADNDFLQVGANPSLPSGMTYTTDTGTRGKLTYTLYPSQGNVSQTGTISGTFTLTAAEQPDSVRATAGDSVPFTVSFNVSTSCTNSGTGSTVTVSSSSMSSSSMMMSSSSMAAPVASAVAVASSKAATVEIDAPSTGKGSATVRTGGAY
jgi:hypothetical protein